MNDNVTVSFNKLWKLLVDHKMSTADLRRAIGIGPSTLTKMRKDGVVSMEVIIRICAYFDCNIGDIMDVVKTKDAGGHK
jgi:DNA-binding Xre family transcriptional regulator